MLLKLPFMPSNRFGEIITKICLILVISVLNMEQVVQGQTAYRHTQMQMSTIQAIKRAPDTDLSRALLGGPQGTSTADIEASDAYDETALAKSGTKDSWAGRVFYLLGMGHFRLGKYQDALADFEACTKLPEPYSGIHLAAQQMRMMVLERTGDYNGAITASYDLLNTDGPVNQRLKYQSTALLLRTQWQSIYHSAEGMKEAAVSYRDFLEYEQKHPSPTGQRYDAFALRSLGGALQKSGQARKALDVYSDYLYKYPQNSDAIRVAMDRLSVIYGGDTKIPTDKIEAICSIYPINNGYGEQVLYQLGVNYFINGQFRPASYALGKAWHIVPDAGDTAYSIDLAAEAALLDMRCLNLAGLAFERDAVAKEIMAQFKGTQYAQDASSALAAYHADTQTFSGAAASTMVRVVLLLGILLIAGLMTYIRIRRSKA